MKLSRILSNRNGISRQQANALIAAGRVTIDGVACREPAREVSRFARVLVDNEPFQAGEQAHYLMLNKPAGVLSATRDQTHTTVLELIAPELRAGLHIAGRLDRASTGLLILTNDGAWSRRLTEPVVRIPKVYRVTTRDPISADTQRRFAEGIWFAYEGITTSPAEIEPLGGQEARVTIYEGRYHQVKRMFHAVGNQVTSLHRERMGAICLDNRLMEGQYRPLTTVEVASVL
ncbi:MAG: pseudouridine synthase [Pseudomonadota bacterium]|nr:pseudouridine synthase [Pseudomonadota bacterium]